MKAKPSQDNSVYQTRVRHWTRPGDRHNPPCHSTPPHKDFSISSQRDGLAPHVNWMLRRARDGFRGLLHLAGGPSPAAVASTDDVIAGPGGPLRLRHYVPPSASNQLGPTLLFMHGGGFYAGSIETHDGICRALADASGCRVVAVNYRLAPEHPFPAAIEDGLAAVMALYTNAARWNIDPSRIAVGGNSVGGNLAAVICQEWRRLDQPPLAAQLLICPALDAVGDMPSRQLFPKGYYLESDMIADNFACYCPAEADDPSRGCRHYTSAIFRRCRPRSSMPQNSIRSATKRSDTANCCAQRAYRQQ